LDVISEKVDGALLLFAPESETTIRANKVQIPNLNVLFEFGYFYGHFGKNQVGMLKYGEFYLPSDFGGYIHITGSKFFKRGKVVQVGKRTTNEFNRWADGL
jgi:predicted nucleotide-binding protein